MISEIIVCALEITVCGSASEFFELPISLFAGLIPVIRILLKHCNDAHLITLKSQL